MLNNSTSSPISDTTMPDVRLFKGLSIFFFVGILVWVAWHLLIVAASWGTVGTSASFYYVAVIGSSLGILLNFFIFLKNKKTVWLILVIINCLILIVFIPSTYGVLMQNSSVRSTFGIQQRAENSFTQTLAITFAEPVAIKDAYFVSSGMYIDLANGWRVRSVDIVNIPNLDPESLEVFLASLKGVSAVIKPAVDLGDHPEADPKDIYANTPLSAHIYVNDTLITMDFIYSFNSHR